MSWFGLNLPTPLDYTGAEEFADAFKTARVFQVLGPDGKATGETFSNRLPRDGEDCKQVIFTDGPLEANGEYTILFKGQMNVGLTGGSPAELSPLQPAGTSDPDYNVAPVVVRAKQGQSAQLHLTYKGVQGLTDLKILRPDCSTAMVWGPRYLKYLDSLGSGPMRSMSWLKTNSSSVVEFEHFTEYDDLFWRGDDKSDDEPDRGAPFDLFLILCQLRKVDPWVNIPHAASDACVRKMAEVTKKYLADGCWVYLELSNEHWNTDGRFKQAEWFVRQADPRFSSDKNERRSQAYARRLCQVARIWREVFKYQEDRIRVVAAGHINNSAVLKTVMKWCEENEPEKTDLVWGLAVTGYFGSSATDLAGMRSSALSVWRGEQANKFFETCKRYDKFACVYEGGASSGDEENDALVAMHLHPDMEQIVFAGLRDFQAACLANGVRPGPYMYFLAVHVFKTLYGLSPHVSQLDAPKAKGFRTVATQTQQRPSYVLNSSVPLLEKVFSLQAQLVEANKKIDELGALVVHNDQLKNKFREGLDYIVSYANNLTGGQV